MEKKKSPKKKAVLIKRKPRNNRSAGHNYEVEVMHLMHLHGFPHVGTSRFHNRMRDHEKVDLVNKDELKNGRLPYNIQCKNSCKVPVYPAILGEMPQIPGIINVIFHKKTGKKKDGGVIFKTEGHYAILEQAEFLKMAQRLQTLEAVNKDVNY